MAITKAQLKKKLRNEGIKTYRNTAGVSFVKKSAINKLVGKVKTVDNYKGFQIDQDGKYFLIYDTEENDYLETLLEKGQPQAESLQEAKRLVEIYMDKGDFDIFDYSLY